MAHGPWGGGRSYDGATRSARRALRAALLALLVSLFGASAADAQWRCASEQKIEPEDLAAGDIYAAAVAVPVRLSVVGGPGAVYVFEDEGGGTWSELEKVEPSDGAPQDAFGFYVSIDERTLLTGSWRDDGAGPDSGSAYFFTCTGERTARGPVLEGGVTRPALTLERGELVLDVPTEVGGPCWVALEVDGRRAWSRILWPGGAGERDLRLRLRPPLALAGRHVRAIALDRHGPRLSERLPVILPR